LIKGVGLIGLWLGFTSVCAHLRVVPADPKGVLREVVGAKGEELGDVRQMVRLGHNNEGQQGTIT